MLGTEFHRKTYLTRNIKVLFFHLLMNQNPKCRQQVNCGHGLKKWKENGYSVIANGYCINFFTVSVQEQ